MRIGHFDFKWCLWSPDDFWNDSYLWEDAEFYTSLNQNHDITFKMYGQYQKIKAIYN